MNHQGNRAAPAYQVLSPLGINPSDVALAARQTADLNGKTICELDGRVFRANETFPLIRARLRQRYPGAKFIEAGEVFSPGPEDQAVNIMRKSLADLRAALIAKGVDAVISGNGA